LFTSFFGLSLSEISSNTFNKDDIKEVELIRKWRMFLLNNKWEDLFDDIIISSNISERMKSLKEIQSLSIFKQISSYCIEYLSKGKSIEDLIRNLKNLSKGGNFDNDEQNGNIIEKSTNFDCVQIMTIHASKGLQFPVVLGVCGFKQPISSVSVTSFHKDNKQVLSFRMCEEYRDEQIAEWKRLFYVAYTRAQFIMILPKYKKNGADFLGKSVDEFIINNQDSFRVLPNMYKSYQRLRDEVSAILKASNNIEDDLETKENQNKALKLIINDLYTKGSYKHSYSSLSHNEDETLLNETFENKEGITEEGLSKYDKNSIVINGDYNQFVNPISIASDSETCFFFPLLVSNLGILNSSAT
jgi:exodeoxyribonuclease V beta subunit